MADIYLNGRLEVRIGDVTQEKCDAIVNAANSSLLGGGGVDGAIHAVGGLNILRECREIRKLKYPDGLPDGEAVITTSGNLPCKKVIHTVGPVWHGGNSGEPQKLANCYANSLKLCVDNQLETVAFPAISTGVFGYPKDQAAKIASQAILDFLAQNNTIKKVILIFFMPEDMEIFLQNTDLS